ncbi:MAG TPA: substrate-binding domain-containing protein [Devosia sp.]|nr:substrate-binding domain-containing protein [Devosia sp.]
MGKERGNGVDGAIRLLLALAEAGGSARTRDLLPTTGLPRASLFRIGRILASEDVLVLERGRIGLGPAARALIKVHADRVAREDEERQHRLPLPVGAAAGLLAATAGPISLSRPHLRRSTRRFRIGFANASLDNPWRVALMHAVEHGASALGTRIERVDICTAQHDARRQAEDIAALARSGIDGLLVSAVMSPHVDAAVAAVHGSGLPVVLVDRGVSHGVPHTSFVTTSDSMIGGTTARWLAETLGGEGNVLMLPGHPAAEPAQHRLLAAETMFQSFPGIRILGVQWTYWHPEVTRGIIDDALASWGNSISGVWCDSGQQGLGSLKAFVAAGKRPGEIPPHTGGDQNLAYKLAIRHRVKLCAIDYPPAMGTRAVEVLYAAMCGKWVPREVDMPSAVIITKGHSTRSVRADVLAEDHVRWDLPDDLILSTGLGPSYNPRSFRIHYPGNRYNRSAGRLLEEQP